MKMATAVIQRGVAEIEIFLLEVKQARIAAGLGEMTPTEVRQAQAAWDEAKYANRPALRTIVESKEASKAIDKLPPSTRKTVSDTIDFLLEDKPGKNQHRLRGDLDGFWAIDVAGSGKGRGKLRIVYQKTNSEIYIHSVQDYH